MKSAYTSVAVIALLAGSLPALAASQTDNAQAAATSNGDLAAQHTQVKTSDTGWAVPQSVTLEPQTVHSYGAAIRPGPQNRQLAPVQGDPVESMPRPSDLPGRG